VGVGVLWSRLVNITVSPPPSHTCMQEYTRMCIHERPYARVHTYTHTHTCRHARTGTHTHTRARTHTRAHTSWCTQHTASALPVHLRWGTHAHTHTHAYTHLHTRLCTQHTASALPVHLRWVSALEEEFFRQGDAERSAGMTISPLFDRNKQGISKSQVCCHSIVCVCVQMLILS